jgi:hypothetical protein
MRRDGFHALLNLSAHVLNIAIVNRGAFMPSAFPALPVDYSLRYVSGVNTRYEVLCSIAILPEVTANID